MILDLTFQIGVCEAMAVYANGHQERTAKKETLSEFVKVSKLMYIASNNMFTRTPLKISVYEVRNECWTRRNSCRVDCVLFSV